MFSIAVTVSGLPTTLDVPRIERVMEDAARAVMRRRGLPRGANLVGAAAAARDAAELELQSQIDQATGHGAKTWGG